MDNVYIIDANGALKFKEQVKRKRELSSMSIIDYSDEIKYYQKLISSFRPINNLTIDDYKKYEQPIFLIQRAIDFDNEIKIIFNDCIQSTILKLKKNNSTIGQKYVHKQTESCLIN